jgi:hypothetical protein
MENWCAWLWEFLIKLWLSKMHRAWRRKRTVSLKDRNSDFFPIWRSNPSLNGPGTHYYHGFTITLRHTTLGSSPLDKKSARPRVHYQTIHNTHKRPTSMPPAAKTQSQKASGLQTHALDRTAAGIGQEDRQMDGYPSTWSVQRPSNHGSCFVTCLRPHGCVNTAERKGLNFVWCCVLPPLAQWHTPSARSPTRYSSDQTEH